ncbi:hypothetical protein, partial [uncultured Fibrobacter sp.]|uniref:hypothetical protein n=1 Tax=uncultured Fibrobacter sp. TaxID=261512 RepID=UPI0025917209
LSVIPANTSWHINLNSGHYKPNENRPLAANPNGKNKMSLKHCYGEILDAESILKPIPKDVNSLFRLVVQQFYRNRRKW